MESKGNSFHLVGECVRGRQLAASSPWDRFSLSLYYPEQGSVHLGVLGFSGWRKQSWRSMLDQGRKGGDLYTRVRSAENEAEKPLFAGGDWNELGRLAVSKGNRRRKGNKCLKREWRRRNGKKINQNRRENHSKQELLGQKEHSTENAAGCLPRAGKTEVGLTLRGKQGKKTWGGCPGKSEVWVTQVPALLWQRWFWNICPVTCFHRAFSGWFCGASEKAPEAVFCLLVWRWFMGKRRRKGGTDQRHSLSSFYISVSSLNKWQNIIVPNSEFLHRLRMLNELNKEVVRLR